MGFGVSDDTGCALQAREPASSILPEEKQLVGSPQARTETAIAQHLDDALKRNDSGAFSEGFAALWEWTYHTALSCILDQEAAQDLAQEAIIEVYRVAQNRQLTGLQMIGLIQAKLRGWQGVPGLITKYRAENAGRRRMEISISEPVGSLIEDRGLTIGDVLASPTPPPEVAVERAEERQKRTEAHLAKVDTKIAEWKGRIPRVKNMAERETLQAILEYVETRRAGVAGDAETVFKVIVGTFKRRWSISPVVRDWFKAELNLKQDAAVRDRLLRVLDLLRRYGLDKPSAKAGEMEQAITALREEARWLWYEPTDQKTVQVLCHWFQLTLDSAKGDTVTLPALLVREQSQFMLDKGLSKYLQAKLGLRQNTVRKRVDRVLGILTDWGLVEVIKDE